MNSKLLVLFCLVTLSVAIGLGRKQSAGAKGRLMCDGKPESNVLVKMYDDDRGLDLDDHLATTRTDKDGYFELSGSAHEFTTLDPKLNIYHDCHDKLMPCQRKFSIMIPDGYISSGSKPSKLYDAGTMELSGTFPSETRDCLH
ncbi:Transthyretin-like family-containing protein [Aphelenchoides besseyi]|nr:Transthyretin-like family-containing protein [Aphelenchoides besseyi]KAI6231776.1 Transthyretin-like family-containing protein [Aphelenchoides besseyi]